MPLHPKYRTGDLDLTESLRILIVVYQLHCKTVKGLDHKFSGERQRMFLDETLVSQPLPYTSLRSTVRVNSDLEVGGNGSTVCIFVSVELGRSGLVDGRLMVNHLGQSWCTSSS